MFRKYLLDLRYFLKFFIPAFLVLGISVLFSAYYGSHVLQKFYDINLEDDIRHRTDLINTLFHDQISSLETNVRAAEKNDSIATATLYAFDNVVQDASFLEEQLEKFIVATDVNVAIVASKSGGHVLSSKKAFLIPADETFDEYASHILENDGKYYLCAKGTIMSFGKEAANLYLLQEVDNGMISRFSQLAGVPLVLQNNEETVAVTESLRGIPFISCFTPSLPQSTIKWNDTLYKGACSSLSFSSMDERMMLIQLYDTAMVSTVITSLQKSIWGMGGVLFVVAVVLMFFIARSSARQLEMLAQTMGVSTDKDLSLAYREIIQRAEQYQQERLVMANHIAVGKVASQVAHDIRSPLAALDVAASSVAELPEEKRILIRHAVSRIRDIANNLIEKSRRVSGKVASEEVDSKVLSVQLLSSLIDGLVSEKRTQHRDKIGVEIEPRLDAESYGLFAKIEVVEFKRVVSNLVNNAVEALSGQGKVTVGLRSDNDRIFLTVQDTGKGIPSEILPKLMQRGETHGKKGGSGLGLYHAKTTMEGWGGGIGVDSEVGKGTTITLTLPKENPPDWFVPKLWLGPNATVVILDDDISIHQIWQGRLEALRLKELKVHHFSTPSELVQWIQKASDKGNVIYLFDHELIGQDKTGLDLIRELDIAKKGILVTSRYEETDVLKQCQQEGVKMIPKPMAGFVPIEVSTSPHPSLQRRGDGEGLLKPDCILVDDDDLARMNWEFVAKAQNKNLKAYASPEAFLKEADQFDKATPVYIDSDLGNGIKGEEISKEIAEMGFTNIYLATGYNPNQFADLPWLKGIVGKAPPWASV